MTTPIDPRPGRLSAIRAFCLCAVSGAALSLPAATAVAQSALPAVTVDAPQQRARPTATRPAQRISTSRSTRANRAARAPQAVPAAAPAGAGERAGGPVVGFVATRSNTATKTDTPLMETPQSISVITADQLKTQDAQTLTQALRYTAGANGDVNGGSDTRNGGIQIRGFDMTQQGLYLDGLRLPSTPYIHFDSLDPFGAERLEVLKGPSSVMFGGSGPGGILNYVSKLPTAKQFGEISLSGGSFDRYQGEFDFGGPANKEGTVLYRLTGLVRDGGTQVDFAQDNRVFIAPSVTFKPNEDTTLTLLANYQKEENGWGFQFLPAAGTIHPTVTGRTIPINFNAGEPGFNKYNNEIANIGYLFSHNINDSLTFRQNLRYSWMHNESDSINSGGWIDEAAGLLGRYGGSSHSTIGSFAIDNQLEGHFTTGILSHTTLFGIDYRNTTFNDDNTIYSADPINVFNPVYTNKWTRDYVYEDYRVKQSQVGVYAQDQIKLGKLSFQFGGRQDFATTTYDNNMDGSSISTDASAFSGRAGVMYNFDSGIAPYYSYSESFLPVLTISNGALLKPETAHQHEVGIKYQPVGLNAMITLAAFDLTRQNVVTYMPAPLFTAVQTGEVNSRGIELEGTATLAAGFNVRAAYSYIDIVTTKDPVNVGKALPTVPMNRFGIWGDYTFQGGPLAGVQIGGGVRYTGESWGDTDNTFKVPASTVVDALLAYNQKNYRLALNITNIADTRYVASCYSAAYGCFYAEGRKAVAKLTYRW